MSVLLNCVSISSIKNGNDNSIYTQEVVSRIESVNASKMLDSLNYFSLERRNFLIIIAKGIELFLNGILQWVELW